MNLRESQVAMAAALFDVTNLAPALPLFKGDPRAVAQRLAQYRGTLGANREKALAAAYPVLQTLVGPEFFAALSDAYGSAHPSTSGDLNRFGSAFETFLRAFPHVAAYPYFPAVARLEWLLHCVHHAPATPALDAAELSELSLAEIDALQLTLRPVSRLYCASTAAVSVWQAHQTESHAPFPESVDHPEWAVVARPQWKPLVLSLSEAGFTILDAVHQGYCLGDALDRGLEINRDFDFAVNLKAWLEAGLFAATVSSRAIAAASFRT